MGSFRRLLAATLLAPGLALLFAGLFAGRANAADSPVRLLAPAEGAVLQGGATAVLEWAPRPGLARPGEWEEWEAFLSLDDGATYPFRLTPHLDRDLRRVTFRVPSFPTERARLLLRVGDERRELAFALPQRFAIAVPPGAAAPFDLEQRVGGRGEPARPGDRGVLAWVEGARDGGERREVVAAEPPQAGPAVSFPAVTLPPPAVAPAAPPSGAPGADPGVRSLLPAPRVIPAARLRAPLPGAVDLRLLQTRQNE